MADEAYYPKKNIAEIVVIVAATLLLILIGGISYHYLEGWSYIDSFYFSVSTLTTVGYGDITPTKEITRLFTIFYVLIGVSIFFYGLFSIGEYFIMSRIEDFEKRILSNSKYKDKQ